MSLDAFRTSRVFCSDPCKSKDYRKRKDLARQLRAEAFSGQIEEEAVKAAENAVTGQARSRSSRDRSA